MYIVENIYGKTSDRDLFGPTIFLYFRNLKNGGLDLALFGSYDVGAGMPTYDQSFRGDCFWGFYNLTMSNELEVKSFDADTCINCSLTFNDVVFEADKSLLVVKNYISNKVYYSIYDAANHIWVIDSFGSAAIDSWKLGNNVVAFKNAANNMVISGVYNFDQHQWIIDSTASNGIDSLKIIEGTVHWLENGIQKIKGYNSVSGWGNYNTSPIPFFHVSDVSSITSGNLIFVRNYSIGVTSYSIDFGDGIINNRINDWHLYKKNGKYQYQGFPLQDTICFTVTNSTGNITTCNAVGCNIPAPSISSTSNNLCTGDSVLLTANNLPGYYYQWVINSIVIPGATDTSYYAIINGNYQCIITDSVCSSFSQPLLIFNNIPSINVVALGPTFFCSPANVTLQGNIAGNITYQWYRNGNLIPGATNQNYIATKTGNYSTIATNNFGCDSTSLPVFVYVPCATHTGGNSPNRNINTENVFTINVFPNPVQDKMEIEIFTTTTKTISILITDVLGKQIFDVKKETISGTNNFDFDFKALSSAIYFLKIEDGERANVFKMVKQ